MISFRYLILLGATIALNKSIAQSNHFTLKEGDLLFQDLDCGKYCDAIDKVTYGVHNIDFNHVGILVKKDQNDWDVLEAVSKGVKKTSLNSFLSKNSDESGKPKVAVGRLKPEYQYIIENVVKDGDKFIGKEYDEAYEINDDTYYCSELVYYLYRDKNNDAIFELHPMTFKDPATDEFFQVWIEYFKGLGKNIPEGEPGLNPGGISRSDKLDIYFPYSDFSKERKVE